MTLDIPALRKLLDTTPAFNPELANVLMVNADALLRAAEERDALLAASTIVAEWFGHPEGCAWKQAKRDGVDVPRETCDCGVHATIEAIRRANEIP